MIEFKGTISEETRQQEIKNQANAAKIKWLILSIVAGFLLVIVLVSKYLLFDPKPTFAQLFSGEITMFMLFLFLAFLILFIVSIVKPQYNKDLDKTVPFSVKLDNDKIVYEPSEGFGRREFNYANLKKIIDEGTYYVIVSKEHNIRFVCQKDLLVQGSLEEFDDYFSKIISRKGDAIEMAKERKASKKLETKEGNSVVVEADVNGENATKETGEGQENSNTEEKTFKNEKFKGSKNRNEKSFKFALIGAIFAIASVAVTPLVVKFGIGFALAAISNVFNSLFYGGFVIEFFTFIFACMAVVISTVVLFGACILIMPAVALLSLIFPIYQLVAVNRRWFSWVALVLGIASVLGTAIMVLTTLQGM